MPPCCRGFDYLPADARFLGDPVDYVVFDGYSAMRDANLDDADLEVVILDVKHGRSKLSHWAAGNCQGDRSRSGSV